MPVRVQPSSLTHSPCLAFPSRCQLFGQQAVASHWSVRVFVAMKFWSLLQIVACSAVSLRGKEAASVCRGSGNGRCRREFPRFTAWQCGHRECCQAKGVFFLRVPISGLVERMKKSRIPFCGVQPRLGFRGPLVLRLVVFGTHKPGETAPPTLVGS